MAALWTKYLRLLEKFPLLTMAGTTSGLMMTGDGVSQLAIERTPLKKYDLVRTGRFGIVGFCVFGPLIRGWYLTLDRLYKGTKYAAVKMMVTDQLLMSPTFVGTFITLMAAMRGENLESIKGKLKRDFVVVLLNNYKIWPAAQFINFYFMPLQHRVLFVNFVSLGWNTYLAWATEKR